MDKTVFMNRCRIVFHHHHLISGHPAPVHQPWSFTKHEDSSYVKTSFHQRLRSICVMALIAFNLKSVIPIYETKNTPPPKQTNNTFNKNKTLWICNYMVEPPSQHTHRINQYMCHKFRYVTLSFFYTFNAGYHFSRPDHCIRTFKNTVALRKTTGIIKSVKQSQASYRRFKWLKIGHVLRLTLVLN